VSALEELGLRPLSARSVLLSVLLGTHPPELPVRVLVRAGALFGVPEGTVRVALSRMASEGDVEAAGGRYRLAGRMVERQRRQDEGRAAKTTGWDGGWELAVADAGWRGPAARAAMAAALRPLRLAEWRDGVWARPANLERKWPAGTPATIRRLHTGDVPDAAVLAGELWDLGAWAGRAAALMAAMHGDAEPATRFAVSAATVAHLRLDPLLPAALLPEGWPGGALRDTYARFEAELTDLLRRAGEPA
jgi:phenylacetic acid degradation operon negative regulatory protein